MNNPTETTNALDEAGATEQHFFALNISPASFGFGC